MLMALADGGGLSFEGTWEREGKALYLFRETTSGEQLVAFRPDISPEKEAELRQGMEAVLKELGPQAQE